MPITNPLPIVSPVIQEVKPVVKPVVNPVVKPEVVQASAPKVENGLKISGGLKYAKPGGNPVAPSSTNNGHLVNSVPQTTLPYPPNDSYLCNAIR